MFINDDTEKLYLLCALNEAKEKIAEFFKSIIPSKV